MSLIPSPRQTNDKKIALLFLGFLVVVIVLFAFVLPYLNKNFTPKEPTYEGVVLSKETTKFDLTYSQGRTQNTVTIDCNQLNLRTQQDSPVKYSRCVSFEVYEQAKPGDNWVDTIYPQKNRTSVSPDGELLKR